MSWFPVFGVMTVKRTSFRRPGVTSPSIALQAVAEIFSSRTTHCEPSTSSRTERFGPLGGVALLAGAEVSQVIPTATHSATRTSKERVFDILSPFKGKGFTPRQAESQLRRGPRQVWKVDYKCQVTCSCFWGITRFSHYTVSAAYASI